MNSKKSHKKENILLIVLISIFSLYFTAIIYFSFKIEPLPLFQLITQNRLFLISLILLFSVTLFLVFFNLYQIISDRIKNKEGSKFRLRLTFFFLIVTLIPIVPLSVISNNLISKSINFWFVKGIEGSLVNALEASKELYQKFSEESVREWEATSANCSIEEMKSITFEKIDGMYSRNPLQKSIRYIFLQDPRIKPALEEILMADDLDIDGWKRITVLEKEYLIIPVIGQDGQNFLLIRRIPDRIKEYSSTISVGLQNYRTLKILREPIKGIFILIFIVITMPFFLLSIYMSLILSREVTVPIRELAIATQKVANDELDYEIELNAKDELKLLIDSFNKMTDELKVNKELLKHSERVATWQDIARKIAHEIKNPLTPIKLSAERILKLYEKDDRYREILSKGIHTIIKEVDNINDMVDEFSRFTRFPDTRLGKHDIIAIINDVLGFLKDTYRNIEFHFSHSEETVYLKIDKMQVRRALLNIIYNSINAIHGNGTISVECYPGKVGAGIENGYSIVAVTDNGIGIDPEIKDNIFDPYVSKNGKGAGLGLAIVEKIVFDNRGRIWFESEPGKTTFYMEFERA